MSLPLILLTALIYVDEACQSIVMLPMDEMPNNMVTLLPNSYTHREYTTTQKPALVHTISSTAGSTRYGTLTPYTATSYHSLIKWSCASAMVQIETIHSWDPQMNDVYDAEVDEDLKKLEEYSATTLASFGYVARKAVSVPTSTGEKFGKLFYIEKQLQTCDELKEYVRKAVSWSKNIPRAVVACGCEVPVEVYKL